jgi:membrane associated rhomboid family serine protease
MERRLQFQFSRPKGVVLALIIGIFALWVLGAIMWRYDVGKTIVLGSWLMPDKVLDGFQLWRLATYPFIADLQQPLGMLLPMVMIWWFGPELETRWGKPRFVLFLLLTTIAGGVGGTLAGLAGLSAPPVMGPFIWDTALILAWGLTFPKREILLFFVLPLKGIHFVWLAVGYSVLDGISTAQNASHVAARFFAMGMAAALVMGVFNHNKRTLWWDKLLVLLRIRKKPNLYVVPPAKGPDKFNVH